MRLFIAINFNDDTKSRLVRLQGELNNNSSGGSFPPASNMHLTLVFLGECETRQVADIKAVMDSMNFRPFDLMIDRVGRFRREGGDIWWAGVRENKRLTDLQHKLTSKLILEGFDVETRKYSPHITLGRRVETKEQPRSIEAFGEAISLIELMKSERIGGEMVYTAVHSRVSNP